ncbi:ferrous iron transport protein B [Desulfomicrobium apsheronum]|uniref:Ferrous iron transport protein B n=1 Tax=Desulfomicrobium apsheronum TaxID=52560 RepID=A0A1I3ZRH4_9BACT|nr:ferrous iron transport protein B [Desulfomicrobium apsheronum]SFK46722.1 ferrous iron transport protein B [Desulfomicrobium apsheronum]
MNATMALMGNPNSGKTTLFNNLTGARQHVGNYPGITVEKREGRLKIEELDITVVDLPGTYSLTAYTQDELVARNFLIEKNPDAVVAVLDATNLERSLYLVLQILELGTPVIVALNMMDEVRRKGVSIDTGRLSKLLDTPILEMVARTGEGRENLLQEARTAMLDRRPARKELRISYGHDLDETLNIMQELIESSNFLDGRYPSRWLGLKYLENDAEVLALGESFTDVHSRLLELTGTLAEHCRKTLNTEPECLIADYRYGFITGLLKDGVVTRPSTQARFDITDKLDMVLTNRLAGPFLMFAIIYLMFELTFTLGEVPMGWVEALFGWLSETATAILPEGLLSSLIVSGIIDGVGGVLGFTPLIMIMFFFLSFLEDSGYMARMAYMLDRVFRIFGLHGCSVMPFIISGGIPGGCAVPGVMAARTLRSPKEKIATVLTAPFLSCGAKVPVFLLLAAAFFPGSGASALFWITLGGWVMALLSARILRSTVIKGEATPFVMELPPYRMPTLKGMCLHTWERVWQYIKKAGTVILAISILLWAAMTFPGPSEEQTARFENERTAAQAMTWESDADMEEALAVIDNAEAQDALRSSLAGRIGTALELVSKPAGFDWRTNIALLGGFAAKEVIVSSLGTAYSLGEVDPEESTGLSEKLRTDPAWNMWVAVSLIAFVLLYAPCFVTVAVIGREIGWKWAVFSVGFNTILAYGVSVSIYQVGMAL